MSWTKLQLITKTFDKLGMSDYLFNIQPEELQSAAGQLEAMMMTWAGEGINIGWNIASNPDNVDLSAESGLQLISNEAAYLNLAVRIDSDFGKIASMGVKAAAKQAYNQLVMRAAWPRAKQGNNMVPAGAGYKNIQPFNNFLTSDTAPLGIDEGGFLEVRE